MRRSAAFMSLAWLVTAALVAQPWLARLATAAVSTERVAVAICTGSGFKVVSLPAAAGPDADPSGTKDEHRERDLNCTACLVQAIGQALTTASLDIVPCDWTDIEAPVVADVLPTPSPWQSAHRCRAPPLV